MHLAARILGPLRVVAGVEVVRVLLLPVRLVRVDGVDGDGLVAAVRGDGAQLLALLVEDVLLDERVPAEELQLLVQPGANARDLYRQGNKIVRSILNVALSVELWWRLTS